MEHNGFSVQSLKEMAETALAQYFPGVEQVPSELTKAMRYSLFAGGKRIRPALVYLAAESISVSPDQVKPIAAAVEFIHTYSLIHDDLPALDNDDLRRGVPTCHKVFGEDMAILAGDALLTEAFHIVAEYQESTEPRGVQQVIAKMGATLGARGMVGGQALDVRAGDHVEPDMLEEIHKGKTGALLSFCAAGPAIAFGESRHTVDGLSRFGEKLGLAFQIVDDVLDETGTPASLGKIPGSDLRGGKVTYATLHGKDKATAVASQEVDSAIKGLERASEARVSEGRHPIKMSGLRELAKYALERSG